MGWSARQYKRVGPFVIVLLGSAAIVAGGLVAGTVWNLMLKRQRHRFHDEAAMPDTLAPSGLFGFARDEQCAFGIRRGVVTAGTQDTGIFKAGFFQHSQERPSWNRAADSVRPFADLLKQLGVHAVHE